MKLTAILWMVLAVATSAQANWKSSDRHQYMSERLQSIVNSDSQLRKRINDLVSFSVRSTCRSSVVTYKVQCLIEVVKKECNRRQDCMRIADIAIVNHTGQSDFIPARERFKILRDAPDEWKKDALGTELRRRYATLTAKFGLSVESRCLNHKESCFNQGLDVFCLKQAKLGKLTWQGCVSAVIWFVGQNG